MTIYIGQIPSHLLNPSQKFCPPPLIATCRYKKNSLLPFCLKQQNERKKKRVERSQNELAFVVMILTLLLLPKIIDKSYLRDIICEIYPITSSHFCTDSKKNTALVFRFVTKRKKRNKQMYFCVNNNRTTKVTRCE